jgi:hypothetical protein
MKTLSEVAAEHGLKVRGSALQKAVNAGVFGESARKSGKIWLIDDESEAFQKWLEAHWKHHRTEANG